MPIWTRRIFQAVLHLPLRDRPFRHIRNKGGETQCLPLSSSIPPVFCLEKFQSIIGCPQATGRSISLVVFSFHPRFLVKLPWTKHNSERCRGCFKRPQRSDPHSSSALSMGVQHLFLRYIPHIISVVLCVPISHEILQLCFPAFSILLLHHGGSKFRLILRSGAVAPCIVRCYRWHQAKN